MEIRETKPYTFIICGKARNGKDTIGGFIKEYYENHNKKTINLQYSSYIKEYAKVISNWDGSEETKPRSLLQQLGTEIIRKKIDYNFFVDRIIGDIKVYSFFFDAIIITDARAKVEVDKPKQELSKIIAIHVVRPNFDNGLTEEQKRHFTEVDLDDYSKYDYEIVNDSTLDDLKEKVFKILEEVEKNES